MYRNSLSMNTGSGSFRLQRRILLIACLVLLITTVVFGVIAVRNSSYHSRAEAQFSQRIVSAAASAIDEVNRMSGMVTSNTTSRLAKVRQYVYYMEQLNAMSMALGGEAQRLVPEDTFSTLYADLDAFEAQTQAATTSTHDVRTTLLAHLTKLHTFLIEP